MGEDKGGGELKRRKKIMERGKKSIGMVVGLALVVGFVFTGRIKAEEMFLLTENGLNNPEHSQYKDEPMLKTGGFYFATPGIMAGVMSSLFSPIPFSRGILTNGDSSFNHLRRPLPYTHWQGTSFGTLIFDLKKNYFVSKVRVSVLISGPHGTERIAISTWEEMLDAGSLPLAEVKPKTGWNEFKVNKSTDKIRLEFALAKDSIYITISEVEIWGKELPDKQAYLIKEKQKELPDNIYGFDFGPESSLVLANFTPVSEKTVYSQEKGYGWIPFKEGKPMVESAYGPTAISIPGLSVRDRGKEIGASNTCDSLYRDFCAAAAFHHSQLEQEFLVDLPNGKYKVVIFFGDIMYGKPGENRFWIEAEGNRKVEKVIHGTDLCGKTDFEIEVADNQLNLRFGDDDEDIMERSWVINGLLILPINNQKEKLSASDTLSKIENKILEERESLLYLVLNRIYKKIEYEERNKLPQLTKEEKERGYLLFIRDWMKMVYPNTIPTRKEIDNKEISLFASLGEYEPATFGIYPLKDLENVEIRLSDLTSGRNRISKENIEIKVTRSLYERISGETRTAGDYTYYLAGGSWSKTYMLTPKILDEYKNNLSIKKGETQQIWLTFKVPENSKPGDYKGTLFFKPENSKEERLSIRLKVFPIRLKKSPRIKGMYWDDEPYYPQNRKKQLLDMAKRGIRAVVIGYNYSNLPQLSKEKGEVVLDFSRMDMIMKEIKEAGMDGYIPWYLAPLQFRIKLFVRTYPSLNMTFDDLYKYVLEETLKRAREKNWPLLFYPVDEIAERREALKRYGKLIREVPGAKIYVTVNSFDAGVECLEYIDYWCTNIHFTKEQEQFVLDKGKTYMRYGPSYNYNPRISRTVSGFGFWKKPAVAMYYWHYQNVVGNPYNALDGVARDHIVAYPSPDGPIPTIDWEAIREGIDDLNYIYTLESLMDKAKKSGKAELTKEGEKILEEIRYSCLAYEQRDLRGVPNEKYNEFRFRMAAEIIKLQKSLGALIREEKG